MCCCDSLGSVLLFCACGKSQAIPKTDISPTVFSQAATTDKTKEKTANWTPKNIYILQIYIIYISVILHSGPSSREAFMSPD